MPKNKGKMASERASQAVAQPDQFVSGVGRVAETLKPHVRSLIGLGIAMAIVLIGYSVWNWQKARKETKATELYHRALLIHDVPLASATDAAADAADKGDELRQLPARYPDQKARATAALATLDELAGFSDASVANEARLLRAGVLVELGRFDDAVALYKSYAADAPPALRLSAQEGLGYALEAKAVAEKDPAARQKGLEAAMTAFAAMQPDAADDGHALSLYHQGRLLAVLGRTDDARRKLEEAKSKKPDPALEEEIGIRIGMLESAGKPAAPAPATAPVKAPAPATAPVKAPAPATAPVKAPVPATAPVKAPAPATAPAPAAGGN